jgi:2-polyprenyl-6-methoxyphenol hydroxylase-like FAD-dependent oxidoreductase
MDQYAVERRDPAPQPRFIAKAAVVVGAGIAGLAAAGALADWFEHVTVLERDHLPETPSHRAGTPQSPHSHGLLAGGQQALEQLFPGFGDALGRAGAVPIGINRDFREEPPHREAMPQRDFGLGGYTMSRPLIELTLRRRLARRGNVAFRSGLRALSLAVGYDGSRVTAVHCATAIDHRTLTLPADLVVDASGTGQLTTALLTAIGRERPRTTMIGIGLGYTTAIIDVPEDAPSDWKIVLTHADAPRSSRRALILPIEGNRWIMTVAGRGDDRPPGEWAALQAYLRHLTTPTIYNAIRRTTPVGRLVRYGFAESVRRHFDHVADFPDGIIPVGDAICRFNPIYGQGMSAAAKEAVLLHRLLALRAAEPDPLAGLAPLFLDEAQALIETPWMMAAIPDFAFPETRGERPADLQRSLQFAGALSRLAARDAEVQRLVVEVWHMLKPSSVYRDPELIRRVEDEMAHAA